MRAGVVGLGCVLGAAAPAFAQVPELHPVDQPRVVEWLALDPPPRHAGRTFYADPVEQQLTDGTWTAPTAGATVPGTPPQVWRPIAPGADGWCTGRALVGGLVAAVVEAPADGVWILEARGHAWCWHAGAFRAGDPYATGWVRLPVALQRGRNHLLFRTGRGRLRVDWHPAVLPIAVSAGDLTLPTVEAGRAYDVEGAAVVINPGRAPVPAGRFVLRAALGADAPTAAAVPSIPALSVRKVPFRLRGARAPAAPGPVPVAITLAEATLPAVALAPAADATLQAVAGTDVRRITFRSRIDGSLQYYALRPSTSDAPHQALFLSLHGASVEAASQAAAYSAKTWGTVVAPTNRRPFGFDWEDWGRLDAMEVLAHATAALQPDGARIYLTGHSMGGHGTWQVGVLYPDRFAAIGPSAGWIAFDTYGGRRGVAAAAEPVTALCAAAARASHTLDYKHNYASLGIYLLHGAADDNVPADQARRMVQELQAFHHDFRIHLEPEVGHWWDRNRAEPGADCVDWAPMFEFFARRARPAPAAVHRVRFRTPSPGVSARCDWVTIVQAQRGSAPSGVDLTRDPWSGRIAGTTENVARLRLAVGDLPGDGALTVALDGQTLAELARPAPADAGRLELARVGATWARMPVAPEGAAKHPGRCGPFKAAFDHRVCLVYGTGGSPDAQAWARDRARHDAEAFWVRGNAALDVLPDTAFDPAADPERSVVCYGNADTNRAWATLVGDGPLQVTAGRLQLDARVCDGADLAVLACRPRAGSTTALVALIGGTSVRGMRATDTCPIFTSGVAYPDVCAFGADVRTVGLAALRLAGYFGPDWSVAAGEFAWR